MIERETRQKLWDECESTREKARLNSVSLPHAGEWLQVVPSPSLGLQLWPAEFRTSVLYRLGMPWSVSVSVDDRATGLVTMQFAVPPRGRGL